MRILQIIPPVLLWKYYLYKTRNTSIFRLLSTRKQKLLFFFLFLADSYITEGMTSNFLLVVWMYGMCVCGKYCVTYKMVFWWRNMGGSNFSLKIIYIFFCIILFIKKCMKISIVLKINLNWKGFVIFRENCDTTFIDFFFYVTQIL